MTVVWSLIAAFSAVALEYFYRTMHGSWWHNLPIIVVPSLLVSFAICKMITTPGVPLLGALVLWSVAVMGSRIFVSTILLHDKVPLGTWIALGCMVCARVAQQVWR